MFTGIIETAATLVEIKKEGTNVHFSFSSDITPELKVDQSLSHNGVCLTVTGVKDERYTVTAIKETLDKTNLGLLVIGDKVNLERCLLANGRFDGHIVQGHVDCVAKCTGIIDLEGSWEFSFEYPKNEQHLTVEKGSITVNGVSLTVVNSLENSFSVCIIPYTYEHTNFNQLRTGSTVNLEFDIVGKYLAKLAQKG